VPTFYENFLFDNNGDGTFVKNTTEQFHNDAGFESYGACWADYNNDGDLDLFVNTGWANANDFLYKNNLYENNGTGFHYLKFECHGTTGNADAIGTRIYAKANINGQDVWQMREINANTTRGGESGGASGHVVHMGFGNAAVIDTLKIYWPASNTTQIFTQVAANQFLSIYENSSALNNVQSCIADFPVENPAIVTGKLYNDENNNCIFDAGDSPIANHFIKATPGPYFAMTDNDGNYSLEVPEGNYNVTFEPSRDEPWVFRKCNADSIVNLSLNTGAITTGIDFPLFPIQKAPCPCVTIDISSIGIEQDNCPPGQMLSSPCPLYRHMYCIKITNCGTSDLTNIVYEVWFDDEMTISSFNNPSGASISYIEGNILTHFNGAEVTTGTLASGATIEICFTVWVFATATPVYPVSVLLSTNGTIVNPNLIVNGDFESGNIGFTSDYDVAPPFLPGDYVITQNPNSLNTGHNQTDHTTGNGYFLAADGSLNTSEYFWISQNIPVSNNTNYLFNGYFNNIVKPTLNLNDPRYVVEINGTQVIPPTSIDELPNVWINENNVWCSNSTAAQIMIRTLSNRPTGNDLGVDDLELIAADAYAYYEDDESCACDPNDKNVRPKGCGEEGNVPYGTDFEYLVRFENIGTGAAHNIIVRDMLDADLDISSLQILASSHPITSIQVIPNNTLIINFEGIELPGIQYEPANKGFIKFKIKPNDGLPEGTQIENRADIYFDQNEVVLTNTTFNTIRSFPYPSVDFNAIKECTDSKTVDFEYTGFTPDAASFYWEFGPDATPSYSTDINPQNVVFGDYGVKNVTLTVHRHGCTNSVSDSLFIDSPECGKNKVLVCHNGHTICISINALPAHLAQGDCIGECGMNLRNSIINSFETDETLLMNISPNPATNNTSISVFSSADKEVRIQILNTMGVLVETIYTGILESNSTKEISYSTDKLSAGIYFIYMEGENIRKVKKMTIIK
jgi:hypothetical protein